MINMIDGDRLKHMFIWGVHSLNQNRELLNSLNIFPVPDGDTGTNMSLTLLASLKELEKVTKNNDTPKCTTVAEAVANGSLRGARGNSGVILSQLLRGFSKGIKGKKSITTQDFALALQCSSETAYKAVMKPKEGTVLTVARESAYFATEIAGKTPDFELFLTKLAERANVVLAETKNILPALKAAGVVDSGGMGLVFMYEGFLRGLKEDAPTDVSGVEKEKKPLVSSPITNGADIKFAYCTELLVETDTDTEKARPILLEFLEKRGDSIALVNDERIMKIHVHTNNPGEVIEKALKYGQLAEVKIENMRIQHTEYVEDAELKKEGKIDFNNVNRYENENTSRPIGIIAISVGDGLNNIFKELGCDKIIEGGQTMNPSADDIFKAAEELGKNQLILLPNNKNIILAAKQAATLLEKEKGVEVKVIETKSIPQGIGALIAMLHDKPLSETAEAMEAGAKYVKTGQVTEAVRDTVIDGKSVAVGDFIGIIDGEILAVEKTPLDAGKKIIDIFAKESEIITIYYSEKDLEAESEKLCEHVALYSLECESHYGGQPVYTYVISAE